MARTQKEPLRAMTEAERAVLQRVRAASSERVDQVRRAMALLAVAKGDSFTSAAGQAGFNSASAVAGLVARFNVQGVTALRIGPGRGRKPTYGTAARAQIVATAQRSPDRKLDGTGTWSLSTLQHTLRREALPRLGATTVRRVLQDAGTSYQKTRSWCPTGTAQRRRKSGTVSVTDPRTEEKRGSSS
jgi:transposase